MADLNENKLNEFVGKMLGDLGGAFSVPTVRLGFRLGLFDALDKGGAATREAAGRARGRPHRTLRPGVGARPGRQRLYRLRPGQ